MRTGPFGELSVEVGDTLYSAITVADHLDANAQVRVEIADPLRSAAAVIEHRYETGLETDIGYYQRRGFVGDFYPRKRGGSGSLPANLARKTSRLAQEYVAEHDERVAETLSSVSQLQQTFPDLLYSVRLGKSDKPIEGSLEKLIRLRVELNPGDVTKHLRPVYQEHIRLHHMPMALCDVSKFSPAVRRLLKPLVDADNVA